MNLQIRKRQTKIIILYSIAKLRNARDKQYIKNDKKRKCHFYLWHFKFFIIPCFYYNFLSLLLCVWNINLKVFK